MTFWANEADINWRRNGVVASGTDNPDLGQGEANLSTRQVWENTLDNKGRIDGHDTDIAALQAQGGLIEIVADIAARDALAGVVKGLRVHVLDDGDTHWAEYIATAAGQGNWKKTADADTPFTASADWTLITNKPATFPPSSHNLSSHSDVSAAGAINGEVLYFSGGLWGRSPLPLGGAAFVNVGPEAGKAAAGDHNHTGVYAASSHVHAATEITSGVLPTARGGTGSGGPHTANKVVQTDASGNMVASAVDISGIGGTTMLATPVLLANPNAGIWTTFDYNALGIPQNTVPIIRLNLYYLTTGASVEVMVALRKGGSVDTSAPIREEYIADCVSVIGNSGIAAPGVSQSEIICVARDGYGTGANTGIRIYVGAQVMPHAGNGILSMTVVGYVKVQ